MMEQAFAPFRPIEVRCNKEELQAAVHTETETRAMLQAQLAKTAEQAAEVTLVKQESTDSQAEIDRLQEECDELQRGEDGMHEHALLLQKQHADAESIIAALERATAQSARGTCVRNARSGAASMTDSLCGR